MEAPAWARRKQSGGPVAIDCGVERGVVIHLQLAVELEAAGAGEGGLPEGVEAGGKIGALGFENGEAFAIAVGVAGGSGLGSGGAVEFFAGVKDFEGKDGEAVDDEAGRFGVERGIGIGQAEGG